MPDTRRIEGENVSDADQRDASQPGGEADESSPDAGGAPEAPEAERSAEPEATPEPEANAPEAEPVAEPEAQASKPEATPEPEEAADKPAPEPDAAAPASDDASASDAAEAPPAPAPDDKKKWYIIHTYSGFENKVLQSLRQRADAYGMGDKIGEILVPTEDVAEIRDGKKVVTKKKIFPGYVLVNMEMSDEAWHVVRSTPKVTGFLGSGQKPLPMPQDEVDRILNQVHVTKEKPKPKFDYRIGETVKITDGPFSNFTGVVEEVNEDRSTLKVMVSIFGRATPVELEFHQVKRPD